MPSLFGKGQKTLTDMNDIVSQPTKPSPATEGMLWFDTINEKLWIYSGGAWKPSADYEEYVKSRGENLVTNGTGLLGNNTNFSGFTFDGSQVYAGGGSFYTNAQNITRLSDELIPIDVSRKYKFSLMAKQNLGIGNAYLGVGSYDIDGLNIQPFDYYGSQYPITTLATDLKVGDTVINLTSSVGFMDDSATPDHRHSIVFWGYKNSFGYTYPDGTYSRRHFDIGWNRLAINRTTHVITLNKPFNITNPNDAQGIFRAGQKVSPTSSGGSYQYMTAQNQKIPTTWTKYEGLITSTGIGANLFPHGTSFVKLLFLLNRDSSGGQAGDATWVNSLSFTDVTDVEDIKVTLGNMANDNILDYEERQYIKEKLTDIIGYIIADSTTTLPTTATNDLGTSGKGTFYFNRKSATMAGLSVTDAKYVAMVTAYDALKVYLEGLTPIKPWDLRTATQTTNITVVKDTFRDKWLKYYQAELDLANATADQLKKNVDNVTVGGANYASNGNFGVVDLAKPLWSASYTGQVKEVVDISAEKPPFKYAYHVKNTTNANGGIFSPILWDGLIAEAMVDKEVTISFWLKYQNIVVGTSAYMSGRFGELVIEGTTASATKVYSYPRFATPTTTTEVAYIAGTNMTWVKYSATFKLALPATATKLSRISFKHGLENCTGEFWTTGLQIEIGNKATDWTHSPLDLQDRISNVEFKVTPSEIISTVTSSSEYQGLSAQVGIQAGLISSKVTSTEVTNIVDASKSTNHGYRYYKQITVYGASTSEYYPVVIKGGYQEIKRDILIKRGYYEQAPPDWNTPTHMGGLTVKVKTNFGSWGGANYSWEVHELEEMYSKMFAGAVNCGNGTMFAIFLRGGGTTGAVYHIYSDQPLDSTLFSPSPIPPSPQIAYAQDKIFESGASMAYAPAPRTYTQAVIDEIAIRNFIKLSQNLETRVSTAETKITPTAIVSTVTSSTTYINALGEKVSTNSLLSSINQSAEAIKISATKIDINGAVTFNTFDSFMKGVLSNADSNIINANPHFLDWSATNPAGYDPTVVTGLSKVASGNGMGNAVQYVVGAGGNIYLTPYAVTTSPYYQYMVVESTFNLVSGTIDGAGVLLRYEATTDIDNLINFKSIIPSPTLNQWYTITKTVKVPSATATAGYTGYSVYPMGGSTSISTVSAKTIQFDSLKVRPATEQEINAYETGNTVSSKVTSWDTASADTERWKYSGQTTIDGGKVQADTISALQMSANSVTTKSLVTTNPNLVSDVDSFEQYNGKAPLGTSSLLSTCIVTDEEAYHGTYSLKTISSGVNSSKYLNPNGDNSNGWMKVQVGKQYIISGYVKTTSVVGTTVSLNLVTREGKTTTSTSAGAVTASNSIANANGWVRIFALSPVVTGTNPYATFYIRNNGTGITTYWDAIQIEEYVAGNIEPSSFATGGTTIIDGGNIKTNTLSAISADLGTITAGTLTSATINSGLINTLVINGGADNTIYFGASKTNYEGKIDYDTEAFRFQRDANTYLKVNRGTANGYDATNRRFLLQMYGGGTPIFNFGFSDDGSVAHRTIQAGNSRLKFLNGGIEGIQVRKNDDSAYTDLYVADVNLSGKGLAVAESQFASGTNAITPVANDPTFVTVSFGKTFSSVPDVVCTPVSSAVGSTVLGWGVTEVTTTNFKLWVYRTSSTATSLNWIATNAG